MSLHVPGTGMHVVGIAKILLPVAYSTRRSTRLSYAIYTLLYIQAFLIVCCRPFKSIGNGRQLIDACMKLLHVLLVGFLPVPVDLESTTGMHVLHCSYLFIDTCYVVYVHWTFVPYR